MTKFAELWTRTKVLEEKLCPFENNASYSISNADHGQEKAHYFKRH